MVAHTGTMLMSIPAAQNAVSGWCRTTGRVIATSTTTTAPPTAAHVHDGPNSAMIPSRNEADRTHCMNNRIGPRWATHPAKPSGSVAGSV